METTFPLHAPDGCVVGVRQPDGTVQWYGGVVQVVFVPAPDLTPFVPPVPPVPV